MRLSGRQIFLRWLQAAFFVTAAVLFCIEFVDLPLARRVENLNLYHQALAGDSVQLPVMILLAAFAVGVGLYYMAARRPMPRWVEASLLAGLALLCSEAFVNFGLKPLFGRNLPFWYLATGQSGFHWFHLESGMGAFPSGHSAQWSAFATVLWIYYPRGRLFYVGGFVVLVAALILGGWHFLSDTIAGGFVGVLLATFLLLAWQRVAARWALRQPVIEGNNDGRASTA